MLISWLLHARDSLRVLTYGLQGFQALWLTCESVGDIWKFEASPTAAARERSSNGREFRRLKLAFALVSFFVSGRGISIRPQFASLGVSKAWIARSHESHHFVTGCTIDSHAHQLQFKRVHDG